MNTSSNRFALLSHRAGRRIAAVAAATAVAAAPLTLPAPAEAALSGGSIYFGAAGDAQTLRNRTGAAIGDHDYAQLSGSIPNARMITVNSSASWRTVANAGPGSSIHSDLVRWARALSGRGHVMLAYGHEPEVGTPQGTPAEFKAAFRNVVKVMRANGASNVRFTLQMTAWSFRVSTSSKTNINNWYPGDDVVDVVGADAYNWFTCGEGQGRWMALSGVAGGGLQFARAHGKQFALPEFGVHRDSRRAAWLNDAKTWLEQNKSSIAGAYYFNRTPTNMSNSDCSWTLTTTQEFSAIQAIARDADFTA